MLNKNPHEYLQDLIVKAYKNACDRKHGMLLLEHILYAFLTEDEVKQYFLDNGYDYDNTLIETNNFLVPYPLIASLEENEKPELNLLIEMFVSTFLTSIACNEDMKSTPNTIKNIMLSLSSFLFMKDTFSEKILTSNKINFDIIVNMYQKYNAENILQQRIKPILDELTSKDDLKDLINDLPKPKSDPSKYLINLNEIVKDKNWIKIVGREKEIDLLEQIILRKDKPNAILVGNPGIGKTKIIEGFTKKLVDDNSNIKVFQLDTLAFTSNIMFKGELEKMVIQ